MAEGTGQLRAPSPGLIELIEANAPLWAGEAEVVRTYWDWSGRSLDTDEAWLLRQCHKELFDGFVARLDALGRTWTGIERHQPREAVLELSRTAYEELAHYCAFADAYEALGDGVPALDVETVRAAGWPENDTLVELRARHVRQHGELGRRALLFTEGGYCTLFAEGMRLAGRGGVDDAIAAACARVHDDEFEHMLQGIAGLDSDDGLLGEDGWQLLALLTVEQMRARIRMRNAQFGHPLPEARVLAIEAGEVEALAFDYARAGLRQP